MPDGTTIDGALLQPLAAHPDERGSFSEIFRQSWIGGPPAMVQANLSRSRAGVLRGLHFHREQADFWIPLSGTVFVALYDLREDSPTEGLKSEIRLESEEA